MKKQSFFPKYLAIAFLAIAAVFTGCKKESIHSAQDDRLEGIWSHNRSISPSFNILTQLELNEDGSGTESVFTITTSGGDTPVTSELSWSTESNSKLILDMEDGTTEIYTYELQPSQQKLILTSESGASREFFFTE